MGQPDLSAFSRSNHLHGNCSSSHALHDMLPQGLHRCFSAPSMLHEGLRLSSPFHLSSLQVQPNCVVLEDPSAHFQVMVL